MFKEYDVVRLKCDMPAKGLTTRDTGTIVLVYGNDAAIAYEVDFTDKCGQTVALLTLKEEDIERV